MFVFGSGVNFPVALEGALKLKEISYIHAEGYPAAEMKHGPIALIDQNMPVIVVAINKGHYDKTVSNIQEIKSRKGKIIAIVTEGDTTVKRVGRSCDRSSRNLRMFKSTSYHHPLAVTVLPYRSTA